MEATTCKFCGETFSFEPIIGLPFSLKPTVCNACDQKNRVAEADQAKKMRYKSFQSVCPAIYRDTDPNHPSMPPAEKLARILTWQVGPVGLILHGHSRTCKTRCAWLLIKKLIVDDCKSVVSMTSVEFADGCALAASTGADAYAAWKAWMNDADVLFIDDLGKNKMTERVEADLYDVIETRTSNRKPILFTTNFAGKDLIHKFSEDRGKPIISRIREFTQSINL